MTNYEPHYTLSLRDEHVDDSVYLTTDDSGLDEVFEMFRRGVVALGFYEGSLQRVLTAYLDACDAGHSGQDWRDYVQ